MIVLETLDANDQLLEVDLDDATYFLHLSWNSEAAFWALEVQDYNQQAIVSGIAMVPNVPLLNRIHYLSVPAGELMALVLSDPATIDRDSFTSGAASLIYMTQAEVEAAAGST